MLTNIPHANIPQVIIDYLPFYTIELSLIQPSSNTQHSVRQNSPSQFPAAVVATSFDIKNCAAKRPERSIDPYQSIGGAGLGRVVDSIESDYHRLPDVDVLNPSAKSVIVED